VRYLITIEYNGGAYSGWQRQKNAISIQEILEVAIETVMQQKIALVASGRTDKGVHAIGQMAHFDASKTIAPIKILLATNTLLPEDIRIRECGKVSDEFHAQFFAKRKTYVYRIYVSQTLRPLKKDFAERVHPPLDENLMRLGAEKLIGEHDFVAFSSMARSVKTTIREIYRLDITRDGEDITFEIEGNGFIYNMVRIIIGTLVNIGKGILSPDIINEMLSTGNRNLGGKTFPARGLCLTRVEY
jgi:tRNA pseudouridine38-40 synthase